MNSEADFLKLEQSRMLYDSLPANLTVSLLLGIALVSVNAAVVPSEQRWAWLGLLMVVLLLRGGLGLAWWRHGRSASAEAMDIWLRWFRLATIAAGVVWGVGGVVLFPSGETAHQVFLVFVLTALAAGGAMALAMDRLSAFGFLYPASLPSILLLASEGGDLRNAVVAAGLAFLLFAFASARRVGRNLRESLRLRYQAVERESALEQASGEMRRLKEHAEAASRAKSEFLASMSHELRTPLNSILGYAQLLRLDVAATARTREQGKEIERAGQHLLSLVNELIDLAKIDAGQLNLTMEPVAIKAVVADSLAMVAPLAAEQGVRLGAKLGAGEAAVVQADYVRLRQVAINLLANAIKYNRRNGSVLVSAEYCDDKHLRLTVTDTGPGIPAALHGRLFNAFDRLGEERGAVEGTGIGLAITRRIVEAMGGEIGFHSVEGEGSRFWVVLPVLTATVTGAATPESAPLPCPAPSTADGLPVVLYIEDNSLNLRLMRHIFANRPDLELRDAPTAEVGLGLARIDPPAVILMDINLPGMDGYAALRALQNDVRTSRVPVFAVTADAMQGDRERGEEAGFAAYLTKPIDIQALFAALDRALGSGQKAVQHLGQGGQVER